MRSIRLSSASFSRGWTPRFRFALVRGEKPRRALLLVAREVDRTGLGLRPGGDGRSRDVEGRGGESLAAPGRRLIAHIARRSPGRGLREREDGVCLAVTGE